ncbi:MAG: DNA-directed RNA polymerase subunit omega [Aquificaceae bacterium]|nr:DNA-directed RNA polymerase subunit omega [Aquificaceae bacterium]MCX8060298.1 DNA-directed RNA polymerase subunit omega [Aquificaceae bacterium]MDW8096821.1 DNA-directed RNA polymerase subunit omega [Aquificaceae bacterium]
MDRRPRLEEALKKVSSRYELVHACAKRVRQLMEQGEDIFIRDKARGELIKKTFQAIEDIAQAKVRVVKLKKGSQENG